MAGRVGVTALAVHRYASQRQWCGISGQGAPISGGCGTWEEHSAGMHGIAGTLHAWMFLEPVMWAFEVSFLKYGTPKQQA